LTRADTTRYGRCRVNIWPSCQAVAGRVSPCWLRLHHSMLSDTMPTHSLSVSFLSLFILLIPSSYSPLYRLPAEIDSPVYVIQSTAAPFISAESNLIGDRRTSSFRHQFSLFTRLRRHTPTKRDTRYVSCVNWTR